MIMGIEDNKINPIDIQESKEINLSKYLFEGALIFNLVTLLFIGGGSILSIFYSDNREFIYTSSTAVAFLNLIVNGIVLFKYLY